MGIFFAWVQTRFLAQRFVLFLTIRDVLIDTVVTRIFQELIIWLSVAYRARVAARCESCSSNSEFSKIKVLKFGAVFGTTHNQYQLQTNWNTTSYDFKFRIGKQPRFLCLKLNHYLCSPNAITIITLFGRVNINHSRSQWRQLLAARGCPHWLRKATVA